MDNKLIRVLLPMNLHKLKLGSTHLSGPGLAGLGLLITIAPIDCKAGATNQVFNTRSIGGETFREEWQMRATGDLQGDYAREMLPAEQFPEGQWGVPTNGIQMSIRVCSTNLTIRTNLTIGQPVCAAILIRNTGGEPVRFGWASWINYPFFFSVTRNGRYISPEVPPIRPGPRDGSMGGDQIPPGSQHREILRLDKIYDLSLPGDYEVSAELRRGSWSARSGTAKFRLIGEGRPESPSESKPPAQEKDLLDRDNTGGGTE
jgi:hypothetical protein